MSDRWKIEFKKNGKSVKVLRNQTGNQLRKVKNDWAANKRNPGHELNDTEMFFEAETNLKST